MAVSPNSPHGHSAMEKFIKGVKALKDAVQHDVAAADKLMEKLTTVGNPLATNKQSLID